MITAVDAHAAGEPGRVIVGDIWGATQPCADLTSDRIVQYVLRTA
jgi:hypothetical protein